MPTSIGACLHYTLDREGETYKQIYNQRTADACPVADAHWAKGGCVVTMPTSRGARLRLQLDRSAEPYKTVLNTLIYVLLNLRALQRIRQRLPAHNGAEPHDPQA